MTITLDPKKETCTCPVCRSDVAYLVPCKKEWKS